MQHLMTVAYVEGLFRLRNTVLKQSTSQALAIQNWYTSYSWCLTTVSYHSRSYETMTQSNSVNLACVIHLIGLLQCCIGEIRWPQGVGTILQLFALGEVHSICGLKYWEVGVCQRICAHLSKHFLATHQIQSVMQYERYARH